MTLKNKNICSMRLSLTLALMTLMPLMGMMMLMTVVTMMLTQNWIFNESFLQQLSDSASRPSDGRGWKGEEDQVSSMTVMMMVMVMMMMMVEGGEGAGEEELGQVALHSMTKMTVMILITTI